MIMLLLLDALHMESHEYVDITTKFQNILSIQARHLPDQPFGNIFVKQMTACKYHSFGF